MVRPAQRCPRQRRFRPGEFYVGGHGFAVEDPDVRSQVAGSARYSPADRYVLFELRLSEARCNGYGDVALPAPPRWAVGS